MKQRWLRIRGRDWHPLGAKWSYHNRPGSGDLFAHQHGVWRAVTVQDLERALWNDGDEQAHTSWLTRSVVYAGTNLDLPGGPEARFHTRKSCRHEAEQYERRWIAEDAERQRVLTYPRCSGTPIVHGDTSTECFGGEDDCQGHATHDHGHQQACYAQTHGCPKECGREGHRGIWLPPRPPRDIRVMS